MAAALFFVAILGLLFAGRMQAQAADGRKPLFSFQLWQLGLALVLPLFCAAQVPTIAKLSAIASKPSRMTRPAVVVFTSCNATFLTPRTSVVAAVSTFIVAAANNEKTSRAV